MSAPAAPTLHRGIVKQILSGDSVVIRGPPKGGPPPEKTILLSNILAPKLARRATTSADETKDEPFAWEAREFLRKKLVGESVLFTLEKPPNATRDYGVIYLGKDAATGENVVETLVSEGLVSVRVRDPSRPSAEQARLLEIEAAAKSAGKGKWSPNAATHVRDCKWNIENMKHFVERNQGKPIKAIVEHVRDGSTVRAFLLPDFYHITLMISGIRCPQTKMENNPDSVSQPYGDEAKFFVESKLLQRDVEIILESVNNANFVGSLVHPKGNIAEALLSEGFAHCVDWSMALVSSGSDKLRAAEKQAKEKRIRRWKDWTPSAASLLTGKEKEYTGTVMEIVGADALIVRLSNGQDKKIFLASIRPPRLAEEKPKEGEAPKPPQPRDKSFRPLYDIPHMFEAREFLRKKLVGKKVNVVVDYVQPASDKFPEKTCCTVTIGNANVAEAMVSKGLATVIRYKQNDDQRSSHYDELLSAETKASKGLKGLHSKKDTGLKRVNEVSGQSSKTYLASFQRAGRLRGVVEFVASGSRMRIHIESESCVITFLLAGISCPRGSRPAAGGQGRVEGEPFGEEALLFTRERVLQHDVEIKVDSTDKAGSMIGWLWAENHNLSVLLVEAGLASVHNTAEKTEFYSQLKRAEDSAKAKKEKIWKDYVEQEKTQNEDDIPVEDEKAPVERKKEYTAAYITEVADELHFYAQKEDQGSKLVAMMDELTQSFKTNPPLGGAYTPKKGDLCAAKFADGNWYRARIEKVAKGGADVEVFYVDYGNRESVSTSRCAALPPAFTAPKPYAHEYTLALVKLPSDVEDRADAIDEVKKVLITNDPVFINVEYRVGTQEFVSVATDKEGKDDIIKYLLEEGFLLLENRRDRRLKKLMDEYHASQEAAKRAHARIWQYGDITEDDATEFGIKR
ncbi:staphylococcal nuclease domain-containing protein 1 [Neocloeon triangulifer]|uniref:staphylococcal nuclease domain-containing protein 1 n=1 Tax=Neocloeon triangulifer TaxID=2078957 RepID=UPI00286F93CA|nr:staphylococcal nuclease domain-containing protein 1 [Neocloeon triangulifer]